MKLEINQGYTTMHGQPIIKAQTCLVLNVENRSIYTFFHVTSTVTPGFVICNMLRLVAGPSNHNGHP